MLSNNHICKVQSQNFKQMEIGYFKESISKVPCSLLISLRDMFITNTSMCYAFACEAYKALSSLKICNEDDFSNSYELMATYGVALSGVLWGYDLKKGKMSLYTSSIQLLRSFASKGILVGKKEPTEIELQTIEKTLYKSDRIKKSLRDCKNKLVCVRLDTELQGKSLAIKCTVPRSLPSLDDTIFVPFDTVSCAVSLLQELLRSNVLQVRMGDKVRNVTLNKDVLASIYGEERASYLCSFSPRIYNRQFYVPSLGASKYTSGVTNLRVEEIDEVKKVGLNDIDLSEINLDYSMVNDHYLERLSKIPDKKVVDIAESFGLDCLNAPLDDLRERLKNVPNEMYARDIWEVMKKYPKVFNTAGYIKKPSKFGSNYTRINIPNSTEELQLLLNKGVFKLLINKRDGSLSTIIGTNDKTILSSMLGDNYRAKYESEGVRLRYAKWLMELGKSADEIMYLSGIDISGDMEQRLSAIDDRTTVIKQSHLVTVRNLQARDSTDFYKNVDLSSLVELIQLT